MKEQMTLEEATEKVANRKQPVKIGGEERLPDAPVEEGAPVTNLKIEVDQPPPPITKGTEPVTTEELAPIMDAHGKPMPEEPTTNLNVNRADYPEEIHGFLDEVQKREDARGNMQQRTTFDQIAEDARAESWEGIQESFDNGVPLTAAQLRKVRNVDQGMWHDFAETTAEFKEKSLAGTLNPQDEYTYRRDLARAGVISNYLMGEKRRLAQSLAALRDPPDNMQMSKLQRDEFLNIMNREMPFDELLDAVAMAKNKTEFQKIAQNDKWYKKMARIGGNMWFNSVLSMWAPVKAAVGGVLINKFIFPVERIYAGMISPVIQKLERGDRKHINALDRQVVAAEGLIEFMGGFQGLRDSMPAIWKGLKDPEFELGPVIFDHKTKPKDTLNANFGERSLGMNIATQAIDWLTQNGSRRQLSMVDFGVRSVTSQQRTMSLAFRVAVNEGLEGKALQARMKEILTEMPDDIFNEQLLAGKQATMTQELKGKYKNLAEIGNIFPGGKFVMPFMRTMSAMVELGIERTPGLAFMSRDVQAAFAAGGAKRDEVVGKQLFGMTLMGIGWVSAMDGKVSSGVTLSNSEMSGMRQGGYGENTIIDSKGNHYSPNFLSPAFEMVMFGAAMWELSHYMNAGLSPSDPRYKEWDAVIAEMAAGSGWIYANQMVNKSVGQGAREALMALDDPDRFGKRKTTSLLTPFATPFGAKHVRRQVDPVRRRIPEGETYMQELVDSLKSNLPGLSDDLPPAIGYFGERRPEYSLLDAVSWKETHPKAELFQALQQNGIVARMPRSTMQFPGAAVNLDVDLIPGSFTEKELEENPEMAKRGFAYMRWSQIKGKALANAIQMAIQSDAYKSDLIPFGKPNESGTGGTKGDIIVTAMRKAIYGDKGRGGALKEFQAEMYGKLKDLPAILKKIREERQPGVTEFVDPGVTKVVGKQKADAAAEDQRQQDEYKRQRGVKF
jgi:hypothetical protein